MITTTPLEVTAKPSVTSKEKFSIELQDGETHEQAVLRLLKHLYGHIDPLDRSKENGDARKPESALGD